MKTPSHLEALLSDYPKSPVESLLKVVISRHSGGAASSGCKRLRLLKRGLSEKIIADKMPSEDPVRTDISPIVKYGAAGRKHGRACIPKKRVFPTVVIPELSLSNKRTQGCPESSVISGAPGQIRTADLLIRSQTLYPSELRALKKCEVIISLDTLTDLVNFVKNRISPQRPQRAQRKPGDAHSVTCCPSENVSSVIAMGQRRSNPLS